MKVILIGGLLNGKLIASYLNSNKHTELLMVYVLKDELGKNVSDFQTFDDVIPKEKITKVDKINNYETEICNFNPDIIFVVGWSQLVSDKIIKSAKIGVIGFHPAKLPKDRGRSVLAWQIAEGYKKGAVSMLWLDSGVDSGNIIGQVDYLINYNDTIRDVLDKVYDACLNLTKTYYPIILSGNIISNKQDDKCATYRRKREYKDGIIDWNRNSNDIYNLVRAVTEPYPGAVACYKGINFIVLDCTEVEICSTYNDKKSGTILSFALNKGMIVKAKDKGILIKKIKYDGNYVSMNELQKYFLIGNRLE